VTNQSTQQHEASSGLSAIAELLVVWTPAQRNLSEVHYILPMFFFVFFYGRLILRASVCSSSPRETTRVPETVVQLVVQVMSKSNGANGI